MRSQKLIGGLRTSAFFHVSRTPAGGASEATAAYADFNITNITKSLSIVTVYIQDTYLHVRERVEDTDSQERVYAEAELLPTL
jgi:hypothetical protein